MNKFNQGMQIVELSFPIASGSFLPASHSYELYSAISKNVPEAHEGWLGIHSVKGEKIRAGVLRTLETSSIRFRLPLGKVPIVYRLAGKSLQICGYRIRCGVPTIGLLTPARKLKARLVVIKVSGVDEVSPAIFLDAVNRKLSVGKIKAEASLEQSLNGMNTDGFARRIVKIKGNVIPGYGVVLSDLSEADSIKIQEEGMGGRRSMGCGLFEPWEPLAANIQVHE